MLYDCDGLLWDDLFDGDHLLTNFCAEELWKYEKAVEQFGDDTLYICEDAYDRAGNLLFGYYALRSSKCADRSEFWKLFRSIR